jgi:hypothetical protein
MKKEGIGVYVICKEDLLDLVNEIKNRGIPLGPAIALICKDWISKVKSNDSNLTQIQIADEVMNLFKHSNII